ncbi:hypothetical protein [Mycolicibacterium sp. P9-22]|uniref:hypothetical protein n=1 Tax=Mycolicibacterium sp. P9-22 TaxID=2024613 RepID=UPI0011F03C96|nr:hypothetical protein [Mycolicibacterium sp. P9-22]KAA0120658.1 hypothetical protein CIW51_04160 [Mycolicibacterium sp. P9-22]
MSAESSVQLKDVDGATRTDDVAAEKASEATAMSQTDDPGRTRVRRRRRRAVVYGVLPGSVLILALGGGYLKWFASERGSDTDSEALRAATDSTVAILSYEPYTVSASLTAAKDRLTGTFKDSYSSLVDGVVIPGSEQKHISSEATVAAAAEMSSSDRHAEVLVFVNQTVSVGTDPPTNTASTVRVTLDRVDGRWLIAQFDPV